ncbi:uncharacterized protein [Ambystoma mexicanum]|uniref:uncharacterized protein n=1 Tax=Ambystoma mexicanum TaxID=8296 RepID=UPI0037E877D6
MSGVPSSLGLLAGYDSSSEEGSDGDESGTDDAVPMGVQNASTLGTTINYFEGGDISSDEDSCTPIDIARSVEISLPPPVDFLSETRLPSPKLGPTKESGHSQGQLGIFANPFREEQKTQLSLLQKHVQLTVREQPVEIGGRKICLAYRKDGRCRFGRSCKFAHDSDLEVGSNAGISGSHTGDNAMLLSTQEWAGGEEEATFGMVQPVQGKRKAGLSQTLIPPKRSMKDYKAQLSKERPWVL